MLIVDDDPCAAEEMQSVLASRFDCEVASTRELVRAVSSGVRFDVVVSRDDPSEPATFEHLAEAHRRRPKTRVILVGSLEPVMGAERPWVHDHLPWPSDRQVLLDTVDRALLDLPLANESSVPPPLHPAAAPGAIIGSSEVLARILDAVERAAHSTSPVLLLGETGTGKDLLAARIHARGPRRHRPYIVVNAGAIPASLLDSELFGHVAGAFTGATKARRGLIAEAEGGTLFLDEIGDLPLELQGRLLRVLEAKTLRPVGSDHERPVDVRFVAATHRDLARSVEAGTFREDLLFRLDVLAIHVPPLRARRGDLPALIAYFFAAARARNPHSVVDGIAAAAMELLLNSPWRGNVRELQSCIERLVVQSKTNQVERSDVEDARSTGLHEAVEPTGDFVSLREKSAQYVEQVLAHTNGDKAQAAAILDINVSTIYRWQHRPRRGD